MEMKREIYTSKIHGMAESLGMMCGILGIPCFFAFDLGESSESSNEQEIGVQSYGNVSSGIMGLCMAVLTGQYELDSSAEGVSKPEILTLRRRVTASEPDNINEVINTWIEAKTAPATQEIVDAFVASGWPFGNPVVGMTADERHTICTCPSCNGKRRDQGLPEIYGGDPDKAPERVSANGVSIPDDVARLMDGLGISAEDTVVLTDPNGAMGHLMDGLLGDSYERADNGDPDTIVPAPAPHKNRPEEPK